VEWSDVRVSWSEVRVRVSGSGVVGEGEGELYIGISAPLLLVRHTWRKCA
jgi:hypothetical protein